MTRSKFIAICAGVAALGFAPHALAQESTQKVAEPPRVLPVEPTSTTDHQNVGATSILSVANDAANAALRSAHHAATAEPKLPTQAEAEAEISVEQVEQVEQGEQNEQVFAAAASVVGTAVPTAEDLMRDEPAPIEPSAEEREEPQEQVERPAPQFDVSEEDFKYTLQVLRRFKRTVDHGIARVDAFGERLRDPLRAGMIDLNPYVPDGGWGEVVELLYDDKCKDAKAKMQALAGTPSEDAEPALVYMWARIQMCAGEEKEGRATLKELARNNDAVGMLAARRLGEKVMVTTASEEGDGEGMYLSRRLGHAKAAAKKDVQAAMKDLDALHREMTRRWDKYKVRRTQAEILESAGRTEDAADIYLALYRKTRGWKINASLEDELERLERKLGKQILNYGERIDRMRHLIARGKYSQAKKVSVENAKLRKVGGKEVRGWMFYRLALQAEREKKREKAVELFEKADGLIKDSEVRPRLYFGWARALRRLDRDFEAVGLYEKLCREYKRHLLCDEATYEAGRLLQYQNEHVRAVQKFDAVLADYPNSDHVPDALWRKAFSLYLSGKYDSMVEPLERLRAEFPNESDESELSLGLKATYWLAMARLKQGERPDAEDLFQETVDRGALTWYGRLAAMRMDEQGWAPSIRLPDARLTEKELRNLASLRVPESPRFSVAAEFVKLGLWKDALSEMRDQVAIHPVPDGAHRLLASIYLANRRPDWAHWIMKKHIDESGPNWSTLRDWGTAFPLDYMDLAHEHGSTAGVSPFLVQAIIRQESGFRPSVKSWAGAMGLMQLMPGTATYTHRLFFDENKRFGLNTLKKPETNVRLGSLYIRLHTAQAVESIPLALAGYNAGPRALESWVERYGDRELDAWVESITYREARGYVRKVFTSYITYSALYGGELPELSLEVPTKLRKWGEVPEINRVDPSEPVSTLLH